MSLRRRSREVNVFGTSALDLFASALAAFIIIALVVLPFFLRYDEVLLEQVREMQARLAAVTQELTETAAALVATETDLSRSQAELSQTRTELEQIQSELEPTRTELEQTRSELEQAQTQLIETTEALEQCRQQSESMGDQLAQCIELMNSTFLMITAIWDNTDDVDLHVIDPDGNEFYFGDQSFPGVPGELTRDITTGPGVEVWEEVDARTGAYGVMLNLYGGNGGVVNGGIYSRSGRQDYSVTLTTVGQLVDVATVTVNSDGSVSVTGN